MKKILLIAILILGVVFYAAVSSFSVVGMFISDGYVLTGNEVQTNLSSATEELVQAYQIKASDLIYKRMSTLYVGDEEKTKFNTAYPMYINGGASMLFQDADSLLIDVDFNRVEAYSGLVLNEGAAFNDDGSRSDWNDYIFAKLSNGLYINSGVMEFTNLWSHYVVPMNSLVRFTVEDGVSYYGFNDGELAQTIITDIHDDTMVRIGSLEISYRDLLLGLKEITDNKDNAGGWQPVAEDIPEEEIPVNEIEEVKENPNEIPSSASQAHTSNPIEVLPAEQDTDNGTSGTPAEPAAPVRPEKQPGTPVSNPGTVADSSGEGTGESGETINPEDNVAGDSEYAVDPEDIMAEAGDYSPSEYQPGTVAQSAPPAQAAAASRGGGSAAPATRRGTSGGTSSTSGSSTTGGLTKIPDYQIPSVVAGTDFTPGVYTLKTSVTIKDPANVLIGGVTYEITILNEYGNGTLYKRVSVKPQGDGSQTVLISGLKPNSKYMVTGSYRYKDEYGRVTTEVHVFLEPREFATKDVSELGPIYLENMMLDTATLKYNSISVPVLKFSTDSDQDAVGSLAKLTVRFNGGTGETARYTNLTEVQLEKVMSYQSLTVTSPQTLDSNTEYNVDVVCYDRYYNQLQVTNSHGVSRTCSQLPSAKINVTANQDGSNSFTVNLTNPDKLSYTDLKLKIRKADGTYASLGSGDSVSITDGGTTTISSLGSGVSFTAVVFATIDVNDKKGSIERTLGSQKFTSVDINIFGPLYLTTTNITEAVVNTEIAQLTDAKQIEAKKKELSTRVVLSLKLGNTTNPNLLQFVDVLTIRMASETESHSITIPDADLQKLLAGEEITVDTNDYTYDALSRTIMGLKSNTTYNLTYSAAKVYEQGADGRTETVAIRVSTTLTKFKTFIQEAEIIINPDTEACYEGFIFMDIKIVDLDGIIGGDYAVLKVKDTDTGKMLGAFQIEKNKDDWYQLRLSADTSISTGGTVYDIGVNKTYNFSFIAEEGYPEKGYVSNYLLASFNRSTGESLTGSLFSLGMTTDRTNSQRYVATFGYTLNVPTADGFPDSMKTGNVYVDKVLVREGQEILEETIKLPYTAEGYTRDKVWKATAEQFSDIAIKSSDIESDPNAAYVDLVVPVGYTQLDYLYTDNAYLNTNVLASDVIGVEAKVYKTGSNSDCMFLATMSTSAFSSSCGYGFDLNGTNNRLYVQYGKDKAYNLPADSSYEISFNVNNDRKLYVNDTYLDQLAVVQSPNYIPDEYFFLGAANVASNGNSSVNHKFVGRIFYCRIYDGDVLVRDYVPAVRQSDGLVGFYDIANDVFCPPTSGTFTAGTETEAHYVYTDTANSHNVNQQDGILPTGYTALEYLTSTGTQFIDLGVSGNSGRMEYQIKYNKLTGNAGVIPFGASDSGSNWSGLLYYSGLSTANLYLRGSNVVSNLSLANGMDHEAQIIIDNDKHLWESTIDGQYNSSSFSGNNTSRTIALFADHYNSSTNVMSAYNYRFTGRIYYFKVYQNNQLIRDMVPCLNENGVPGMYDLTYKQFYSNLGTGTFGYKISDSHELHLAVNYESFSTTVNKKDTTSNDSYIFRYYFYFAEGTSYAVKVPLSNVALTTEKEINTIATGNEFVTKGASNRKYVVIDDIKLDNTNKATNKLNTLRAQIDFQGFTFETYVNYAPIVYTTSRTAKISNLVLKEHVALNKTLYAGYYTYSENSSSTSVRTGGALFNYFYGSCENVYIEYEQEDYPYIYNIGKDAVFWSEIPLNEILEYPEEEQGKYKFGLLNRTATFAVSNYGTIDRFVVDLKTDMIGETFMGGLCCGNYAGATISNGYLFSSTGLNSMAYIETLHCYNDWRTGYVYACGGISGRNSATSTVRNCYALVDVVYNDSDRQANHGGIVGQNYEAGAKVSSCYMVGSTYYAATGRPNISYGPVIGSGATGSKETDLYYITENTFGYTSTRSTEVTYRALSSEMWESSILNSNGNDGFLVKELVAVGCYPLVDWTSNCMPGQTYTPIITINKAQTSFDIAYSFTYTGGIASIDKNPLLGTVGDEAWDSSEDELSGYTQLEYIESSGTQYINTGFIPSDESFSLNAEVMVTKEQDGYLFGAIHETDPDLTDDNKNAYALAMEKVETDLFVGVGRNWKQTIHSGFSATIKHTLTFTVDTGVFSTRVDGTKASPAVYTGMTDHVTPVYAFAAAKKVGDSISAVGNISMRLYSLTLVSNGKTEREMIPVRRNSDKALGMYDRITKKFYPNAGTGNFTAGPECHYLESEDQIVCILLADSDKTRIVYGVDIEGFSLSHEDVLYQHKDGSGINSVYVRVHNPERCLSRYVIKSITFEDDNGNPLVPQVVNGTRYANVEYYKRIMTPDGAYGTNSWTYMQSKYTSGTYPENMVLYADLDFTGITADHIFYLGTFTGKLKGNNHTMSNLEYDSNLAQTLNLSARDVAIGLFRTVEGTVNNLTLDHFQMEGGYDAGILASYLSGATVDNVFVLNSYVSGGRLVGGMAANIEGTTVSNCAVVETKLVHNAGGIATSNDNVREGRNIGGFVGKMAAGTKLLRVFAKDIYIETLYSDMKGYAGGLAGLQEGSASELDGCYATGTIITNATYTGGLVGTLRSALLTFANTYADVDIYSYGSRAAGLIGLCSMGETYNRVGVAFGSILSATLYDPTQLRLERGYNDDRNSSSWYIGMRVLGSGGMTGALYEGSRCYVGTQNTDGTTKITDRYSNGIYSSGSYGVDEIITLDTYKDGNVFGFTSNDYFSTVATDYAAGELPVLKDTHGNVMAHQGAASIGGSASSGKVGIFVDDSSISFTDNGGTYTLAMTLYHGSDVNVTGVYTDFSYVDKQCDMGSTKGFVSLTQGHDLVSSDRIFINHTVNNQTTLIQTGLTVNLARDLYYITAIEYEQDGETRYLKVGKVLNIPQQWKTVANYDEYASKVMGSHCENFKITGDIDFSGKTLTYNTGTTNNMVNRMVGTAGFGNTYTNYNEDTPINSYWTISGVYLDDEGFGLQEDGCWQRHYFRGLISNVLSEFACLTVEDMNIYGSGNRFGLVGDCSGFIYDINFGNSTITTTASTAGLFGFVSEGMRDIALRNITVTGTSGAGTLGTLVGYVKDYHLNNTFTNISARDCTVSGSDTLGGLIGQVNNAYDSNLSSRYHFNNIYVDNMKVSGGSNIGDVFGWFYGVVSTGAVTNSTATASSNSCGAISGYGRYAGCENITVDNCTFKGNSRVAGIFGYLDEPHTGLSADFIRNCIISNCTMSATGYTDSAGSYRSGIGGIVGYSDYSTSTAIIKNCSISDCTMTGSYCGVGGVMGYDAYSMVADGNKVYRCTIRSLNGSGGLIGSNYYFGNNSSYNTYYSNNHVQDCIIYTEQAYAGGLTGNGSRPGRNNMVENCWIVAGTTHAGGVTGHMKNYGSSLSDEATLYYEMDDGNYCAVVRNCHIYGRYYVAGAMGYNYSVEGCNSTAAYAPTMILVDSCDIRGYSNVGGIVGYASRGDGSYGAAYITSSYVKDCVISSLNEEVDEDIYTRLGIHITPSSASYAYYGGIVGQGGASNNCLVENSVIGGSGLNYVGAIGGSLNPKFTSSTVSTARGNESKGCVVMGNYYVGGFYGEISTYYPQTYNNSVSFVNRVTVSDSFSDAKVVGTSYVSGIAGTYSNTAATYRHYDSKSKLDYEVSGQYTLPALIKDLTFTGSIEATGSTGIASGIFGVVNVYTPFADVDSEYVSAEARAMMQRVVLNGVVIAPSTIKGGFAYPLFQNNTSGSNPYSIASLYGESSRQFVVLTGDTQVISTAAGATDTMEAWLDESPYADCVGDYDTILDANLNRTSSSRFIYETTTGAIGADTDNFVYSKLLRNNANMISPSADGSTFGNLGHDAISDYLPLIKFKIEGISHKANGKPLFAGYHFTSKTADPADGTTYYTLSGISQGIPRPGTAAYAAAQANQNALYTEFTTTGTIDREDRSADMSSMLAEKIQVYPSDIDKLTIEFPAEFFSGSDAELGDYTVSSVKFSTKVEKTGTYSKIVNEVQKETSVPVSGGSQVYEYSYNFVDQLNVLVEYKLTNGRGSSFTFVIDPEKSSTGNIQTRNRMEVTSTATYAVDDVNKRILRDGYEVLINYNKLIPSKYQVLESLKNDGYAFIDTGYVFKTKPTIIARMAVNTPNDTYQLGFADNGKNYNFQVNIRANSSSHIWYKYGTSGWSTNFSTSSTGGNIGVVALNTPYNWVFSDYITKDNYTFRVGMGSGFGSNGQTLRLYAGAGVSTVTFYGPVTLYDGDALVGKLYPVKDTETGVLGMYDVVRKQFYKNANTRGTFTAGEYTSAGMNYFIHLYQKGGELYLLQKEGSVFKLNGDGTITSISDAGSGVLNTRSADRGLTLSGSATLFASATTSDASGVVTKPSGSPLYTFQYNGVEIETYGGCSIVGGKMSSDFLYYVKSGNLILVDRKLQPVANGIFAHYEGGQSYIGVLTTKGELVSLGTINLTAQLKDFRNGGIVSLASNITSAGKNLMVEYSDGSMAGYDVVTGECTFRTEGAQQPGIAEYLTDFIDNLFDQVSENPFSSGAVEAASLINYMEDTGTTLEDLADKGMFDTEENYGDFIIGGERYVDGQKLVTGETADAANTEDTEITEEDVFVLQPDGTYVLASQAQAYSGYEEGEVSGEQPYYIYDEDLETWILLTDDVLASTNAKTSDNTAEAHNTGEKAGSTITFTKEQENKTQDSNMNPQEGSSQNVITAEKLLPSEMPQGSYDITGATEGTADGTNTQPEAAIAADPAIVDGEGGSTNLKVGEADGETAAESIMMKKDASQEQYVAILNAETNSYDIYSVSELMNNPEAVKSESSKVSGQQARFLLDKLSAEDEQSASGFSMYAIVIGAVLVLFMIVGIVLKNNNKKKTSVS